MTSRFVRLELELKGGACTSAALAFVDPESVIAEPIWIPRSQIRNLEEVLASVDDDIRWGDNDTVEIEIPSWLAEDKGLDCYAEEIDDSD